MTHAVIQQLQDSIEQRERQLAEQIGELTARLREDEAEAEREALATTAKTVRANGRRPRPRATTGPVLPDGAAYQQIMDVFEHQHRPLRARDLCLALDLPVMPKHVERTRAMLKRLVILGFLDETEPGSFTQPGPQAPAASADQPRWQFPALRGQRAVHPSQRQRAYAVRCRDGRSQP
jgi:hypothetical protein